jgi:hypothetical protein
MNSNEKKSEQKPSHVITALRDVKGGFFHPPVPERSIAVAVRSLSDAVRDPKNYLSKHPEDFQLYQIGSYFDDHGVIDTFTSPVLICELETLKPGASDVQTP